MLSFVLADFCLLSDNVMMLLKGGVFGGRQNTADGHRYSSGWCES